MNIQELAKELYYQWDVGCTTPKPSWDLESNASKMGWEYLARNVAIKILEARIHEISRIDDWFEYDYEDRIDELTLEKEELLQ